VKFGKSFGVSEIGGLSLVRRESVVLPLISLGGTQIKVHVCYDTDVQGIDDGALPLYKKGGGG
jgi:hypothetical protein